MPEHKFRIETGKRWDGSNEPGLNLKIYEIKSGELMIAVSMTATEAFEMLTGGSVEVTGKQSANLDRVGKTMVNESWTPPTWIGYPMPKDDQLVEAEKWARAEQPGWETYEARMTNKGPWVIGRKWIDQ